MEHLVAIQKQLDKELNKYELARVAEQRTGVPKVYLAAGAAAIVAIFLWLSLGIALIVGVATFVYPAMQSIHAAHAKSNVEQWLTYWVLFGLFALMETVEETVVYYLPLYHYIKLAVLLWAFLPQTQGAKVLYQNAIVKFVPPTTKREKLEDKVGAAMDSFKARVTSVVNEDNIDRVAREMEKKFE